MNSSMESGDPVAALTAMAEIGFGAAKAVLTAAGELAKVGASLNPVLNYLENARGGCGSCEIPPACWLPKALGELRSLACAGGTAQVRLRVTNCQPVNSTIEVVMKSKHATKIDPPSAFVHPMEQAWFNATVEVPADACKGQKLEILVWVLGCNAHYLRWTVDVTDCMSGSCQEIEVEDCPDYTHHWYDHFYCARPCFNQPGRAGGQKG